jgi:hypothetical protein
MPIRLAAEAVPSRLAALGSPVEVKSPGANGLAREEP